MVGEGRGALSAEEKARGRQTPGSRLTGMGGGGDVILSGRCSNQIVTVWLLIDFSSCRCNSVGEGDVLLGI